MSELTVIVLAAGKSKRMKTKIPKVLHRISGKPIIEYVIGSVEGLGASKLFLVTGFEMDMVKDYVKDRATFVEQKELLGTGHAVQQVMPHLLGISGDVLILCGDMPLVTTDILKDFIKSHKEKKCPVSLMTAIVPWESDFGRIIRNSNSQIERIVEYRDASPEEKLVKEVSLSIYLFDAGHLLKVIPQIGLPNVQKELYLTDTIYLTRSEGLSVNGHICPDPEASRGVNSRIDLSLISEIMRIRALEKHMMNGVTIIDPNTCHIDDSVEIGMDTVVYPFTIIEKNTSIGESCLIGPSTRIANSKIASGATIMNSIVMGSEIGEDAMIGPFAYIRPDNVIGRKVKIGDFVELKKSVIGDNSKVPHLSYIGDATLGKGVNIGAGTITCNYDGVKKNPTFIGDNSHIGSNTNLVAPVKIGKNSKTGAGAVVTVDVPDNSLAVGVPARIKKQI